MKSRIIAIFILLFCLVFVTSCKQKKEEEIRNEINGYLNSIVLPTSAESNLELIKEINGLEVIWQSNNEQVINNDGTVFASLNDVETVSIDGNTDFYWAYQYYNYLTDTFNQKIEGGGANWYVASKQTIGYYMDPRNFLNDESVFMFESLKFDEKSHTISGVEAILKGSFMENKSIVNSDGEEVLCTKELVKYQDAETKIKLKNYAKISKRCCFKSTQKENLKPYQRVLGKR